MSRSLPAVLAVLAVLALAAPASAARLPAHGVLVPGESLAGVRLGDSADAVNSDPEFASFNDAVAPLLAEASERVELNLLHLYTK